MDIEGLGEKLISQLVEKGMVKNFADLYSLEVEPVAELEILEEPCCTPPPRRRRLRSSVGSRAIE